METTNTSTHIVNSFEAAKLVRKFVGPVYVETMGNNDSLLVQVVKSGLIWSIEHAGSDVQWLIFDNGDEMSVYFDQ